VVAATERKTAEERREAVIDAAMTEFARHGFEGASTDAIARRVGISQPYLFRLFGTKKELFMASVELCLADTLERFKEASEGLTGEEALRAMGEAYMDWITADPRRLRAQLQSYAACDDPEICAVVPGPVSAEVAALDVEGMLKEGRALARIANNVTVKVPLTFDGLKACRKLTDDGTMVNVTLCFSANQALLAAKAGATFVSPFVGRLDDAGQDGMELVREIRTVYDNYPDLKTQILAASIRNVMHVKQAALIGADVATVPPAILRALIYHPLTDKGLELFLADWKKTGQRIV